MTFFLFGILMALVLGSFANVCIWRLPESGSLWRPGSHCRSCGKPIPWRNNIPLLSYLFLKGRCSRCRKPISLQYPIVEATSALLFAAMYWRYGRDPVLLGLGCLLSFSLLVVSVIDLRHRIIPDLFSLGLLALGATLSWANPLLGAEPLPRFLSSLLGCAAGYSVMKGIAVAARAVYRKEALGGGDVKLMAAFGALMGWRGVFSALFLGSLFGTAVMLPFLVFRRLRWGDEIPFGPFLAVGGWSVWMAYEPLMRIMLP